MRILYEHQIAGFGGANIVTSDDFGPVLLSLNKGPFFPADDYFQYDANSRITHGWRAQTPRTFHLIKVTIMADPPIGARMLSWSIFDGNGRYVTRFGG